MLHHNFYYLLNLKGRRVDNHFRLSTYEKENYKKKAKFSTKKNTKRLLIQHKKSPVI